MSPHRRVTPSPQAGSSLVAFQGDTVELIRFIGNKSQVINPPYEKRNEGIHILLRIKII